MPLSMFKKMLYTFLMMMAFPLDLDSLEMEGPGSKPGPRWGKSWLLLDGKEELFMVMLMRASKCLQVENIISRVGRVTTP